MEEDQFIMKDIYRLRDEFDFNQNYSEKRDKYLNKIKIFIDAADEFIQMVEPELPNMKEITI